MNTVAPAEQQQLQVADGDQWRTIAKYDLGDAAIAEMSAQYMPLTIKGPEDTEGFDTVRDARLDCKKKRCAVEASRKQFNKEPQDCINATNKEAKRLIGKLMPIEDHLAKMEKAVTAEREKLAREAEEAARLKLQGRLDDLKAVCCVKYQAELVKVWDDEEFAAKLAEEATAYTEAIERERIAKEEQAAAAEQLRKDREALEEKQKQVEAEEKRLAIRRSLFEAEQAPELPTTAPPANTGTPIAAPPSVAPVDPPEPITPPQGDLAADYAKLMLVADAVEAIDVPQVGKDATQLRTKIMIGLSVLSHGIRRQVRDAAEQTTED